MRLDVTLSLAALAAVCCAAPPLARAQVQPELVQAEHRPAVGLELSLGGRSERMGGGGFDAFSENRWMAELTMAASYRITGSLDDGLTIGALWNHGRAASRARGTDSSLDLDRLSLSLGAHRTVWRRLTVFGRLAPGAVRLHAGLAETSILNANQYGTNTTLSQTHWALAMEAAAGAAFRVGQLARPREHVFTLWLTAEGGYALAGSTTLALASNQGPVPARTDVPVQLGTVTPGGLFMNFAAALTF